MLVLLLRHMFKIEPRENKHLTSEHQLRCKGNVLLCSNAVAKCLRYLINRKNDIDDLIFFCHIKTGSSEIWARPLADGSVAVVLFSHSDSTPVTIKATFKLVSGPRF